MSIKSHIVFNTYQNKSYVFDFNKKKLLLINPILSFLLNQKIDLIQWLNSFNEDIIKIEKVGIFKKKEVKYYIDKIFYLKQYGFFSGKKREPFIKKKLNSDLIKLAIANVSNIVFEVTDSCNLQCFYCGYGELYTGYEKRTAKNINLEDAKKIIDYLKNSWNSLQNKSYKKKIYIGFYGGEPLLNIDFIKEIVKYIKNSSSDCYQFQFTMTTNGTNLDKYINYLMKNRFDIMVSLDGNEDNNSYRVYKNGKTSFTEIVKKIKKIQKTYPVYFKENIEFNTVLHDRNSVSSVLEFFKKSFNKTPLINEINPANLKNEKKKKFAKILNNFDTSLFDSKNFRVLEKRLDKKNPMIKDTYIFLEQYSGYIYNDYFSLLRSKMQVRKISTGTCIPFSKKMYITVNGKILPCETVDHKYTMGYVKNNKVEIDFDKIAINFNKYLDELSDQCSKCYNQEACVQCVFDFKILAKRKCKRFVGEEKFKQYFSSYVSYLEERPELYKRIMTEDIFG